MAYIPPGQRVAAGVCPLCGTALASDEESIVCPACGYRPTLLADGDYDTDRYA